MFDDEFKGVGGSYVVGADGKRKPAQAHPETPNEEPAKAAPVLSTGKTKPSTDKE